MTGQEFRYLQEGKMRTELLEYIDGASNFEVRGMRILLEYFYANEKFRKFSSGNFRGVSVFGSARLKQGDPVYEQARKVGELLYNSGFSVITGAASGVMEAANRGVSDAIIDKIIKSRKHKNRDDIVSTEAYKKELDNRSVGLKISLPYEKEVNDYLGTWVSFHYFAIRKLYFAMLSEGFIRCEGGWGTRDEFWEVATLVQTGKSPLMPIVVLSDDSSHLTDDLRQALEKRYINEADLSLIDVVDTPEKAVQVMNDFYSNVKSIRYSRQWEIEIKIRKPVTKKNRNLMNDYAKKNPGVFGEMLYSSEKVVIRGFSFQSFGHLRKLVNAMNGFEE